MNTGGIKMIFTHPNAKDKEIYIGNYSKDEIKSLSLKYFYPSLRIGVGDDQMFVNGEPFENDPNFPVQYVPVFASIDDYQRRQNEIIKQNK